MRKTSKIKRIFAGLLALLLTVALLPAQTARIAKADETINESTPVSLTIYKYRYDGTASEDDRKGTGELSDKDNTTKVPGDAKLLDDVEFTVYKVAEIVQVDNQLKYEALDAVKSALDHGSDQHYYIDGGMNANDIKTLFTTTRLETLDNDSTYVSAYRVSRKTGADGTGIAQFTNSLLKGQGLYLVVETDAPDVVTQPIDPFLVSLPMTNVNGNGWLYDVYAFPKNGTTTGEITLKKQGKIGNNGASFVGGAQFVLQKKQADNSWTTLTHNDNGVEIGTSGVITIPITNPENGSKITGLSQGTYRFVEIAPPTKTDNVTPDDEYIMDGSVIEFKIDDTGKVYYPATGTTEVTEVTANNYKPTVEKEVLEKGEDGVEDTDWGEAADYSVGDRVKFKVSSTVPENIDLLKHYVLVDEMCSGLTMDTTDQGSFTVTYYNGSTAVSGTGISTVPSYDSTNNKWTLNLNNDLDKLKAKNITSIEVTFTATLTADAVTAGTGNPNTIKLEYTNKLYPDDYNDNPSGTPYEETKTITDKAVVYTFGIELVKTFQNGTPSATINATFDLYRPIVAGDTDTTTIKVNNTDVEVKKIGTYTTDAAGKITINTSQPGDADKAFSNDTYYFVETATASGYNLLKEPIPVEIQFTYTQTFETITYVTKYKDDGTVLEGPIETKSGSNTTTYNGDPATVTTTSVNVVNNKGFTLPTTGGIGSAIFVFVGVSMMVAAVILFFVSRKKENDKTKQ